MKPSQAEPDLPPWPSGLWFVWLIAILAFVGGVFAFLADKNMLLTLFLFLFAIGAVMLVRWAKARWERQSGLAWQDRPR